MLPSVLQQLLVLAAGICCFTSSEAARPRLNVTGEVGGSVSINCPTIPNKPIAYFYFQHKLESGKHIFVNGFFPGYPLETKSNSRLDEEKNTTVHMFNLTMADHGTYKCHLEYMDGKTNDTDVYINVTANYSQPNVTCAKLSDSMYILQCESHGGYPKSEPRCTASKTGVLHDLKTSAEQDQDGRFSVNFTAYVNCSQGVVSVTCVVTDNTSDTVTLCEDDGKLPTWVIAVVVALIVLATVAVLAWCLWRKGKWSDNSVRYTKGQVAAT